MAISDIEGKRSWNSDCIVKGPVDHDADGALALLRSLQVQKR